MTEASTPSNELTAEEIRERIVEYCRNESGNKMPFEGRKAAVLIPLFHAGGEWHALFTRRSEGLNDHKGQVSFPGGGVEQDDRNVYRAALREAFEEIGLEAGQIEILGRLKEYQTISSFVIYPIVAIIRWPVNFVINPDEVSRVFSIPLKYLGDPSNIEIRSHILPDNQKVRLFYFKPYDGELVWGITARIMVRLLKVLGYLDNDL